MSRRRRSGRAAPRSLWRRRLVLGCLALLLAPWLLVALLRWVDPPGSAFMLAYRLQAEAGAELRHRWVPLEAISRELQLAVIASEDQRFPQHSGFDLDAIRSALADERGRGASTISQQVAKNLFLWSGRSWARKTLEAGFTVCIETLWPKSRIIEVYLNVAEFGEGVYGAEAAARHYFGKPAAGLDRREAATLAAVLPSPRRWSAAEPGPYVRQRVAWIERQMGQLGGPAALPWPDPAARMD